ncbi:MAG: hypothetical protein K2X45_02075 [Phreatobacter sp.]|nr:hypothetical protein [Phreatobacter sp.]
MSIIIPRALDVKGTAFRRSVKVFPCGVYYQVRFEGIRTTQGVVVLTDPPGAKRVLKGRRFLLDVGYFSSIMKAYSFVEELAFLVGTERLDHSALPSAEASVPHSPWTVDFGRNIEPSSAADAFSVLLAALESCPDDDRIREQIVTHQSMAVRIESEGDVSDEDLLVQLEASIHRSMTVPKLESNTRSMDVNLRVDLDVLEALPTADEMQFTDLVAPVAAAGPFRIIAHEVLVRGGQGRSYQLIAQFEPAADKVVQEMIDRITDSLVGRP